MDSVLASCAKWHDVVTDELGLREDLTPTSFVEWYEENTIDALDGFLERLFEETLNARRPS